MRAMRSFLSVFLAFAMILPLFGMFTVFGAVSDVANVNPLSGKSVLFVGDSICEAYCEWATTGGLDYSGWAGRIFQSSNMTGHNIGKSGASLSTCRGTNTVINQLIAQNGNSYDYIIIEGGANDAWDFCPIGNITSGFDAALDASTFAGGLEKTLKYAKENFPNAIIGFIFPFQMPSATAYGSLSDMSEYFSLAKQICNKWDVPYLDFYFDQDFNDNVMKSATLENLGDYVHPNTAGYDILAPRIEAWMKTLGQTTYNLALGKNYTISGCNNGFYWNSDQYGVMRYDADLNDGVASTTTDFNNEWFSLYYGEITDSVNAPNGVGSIVMDLEKLSSISYIRAHLRNSNASGVYAPNSITVEVSADGTNYTSAGSLAIKSDDETIYWADLAANASARYVRFTASFSGTFCFFNEIEIYGSVTEENSNIAAYKGYEVIGGTGKGFYYYDENNGDPYTLCYQAPLTDTLYTEYNQYTNDWFAFYAGEIVDARNTVDGVGTIILNLEDVYKLSQIKLHLLNDNAASVSAPASIKAYISSDKESFSPIGEFAIDNTDLTIYWSSLNTDAEGQFIKLEFALTSNYCMINEIEAYGTFVSEGIKNDNGNVDDGSDLVNIALNKNYTISGSGKGYYNENTDHPEWGISNYNANLTDGINSDLQDLSNNSWFGFYYGSAVESNAVDGVGTVIIDLEADYDITEVRVHLWNHAGINAPAPTSVTISVSDDNQAFTSAGALTLNTNDLTVHWSKAEFEASGRYVKLDFKLQGMFCLLNEIHIYGSPAQNDSDTSDETSSEDTSNEDTSSEDTSSEDTSSEDTSSEDTSSEDTSSEDTSSDDTSSDDTSDGDTTIPSNAASGKDYTGSGIYTWDAENGNYNYVEGGVAPYPDTNNSELTDGIISNSADYTDPAWIGFHTGTPDVVSKGYVWVSVDLGSAHDITEITLYGAGYTPWTEAGIYSFAGVDFYNGETGEHLGSASATQYNDVTIAYTIKGNFTARKVEARIISGGWTFVSEIAVKGAVNSSAPQNLALNKEYSISGSGEGYYNPNTDHPDWGEAVYQADLTDGKYVNEFTYDENAWFGFYTGPEVPSNVVNGLGTVIIDLQKVYDITSFRAHMCNNVTNNIPYPTTSKVYVSMDGTNYTEAGSLAINTSDSVVYWAELNANARGRYVKFEFTVQWCFMFLNEIEIYGTVNNHTQHTAKDEKWISDETGHWKECECGEKLDFAGHNPDGDADCDNPRKCLDCEYIIVAALGHTAKDEKWISDETGHWKECECGEKLEFAEHNPDGDADCENDSVCTECDYIIEEAKGHSAKNDTLYKDSSGHWKKCVCGEKVDFAEHNPGAEADCDNPQKCLDCEYVLANALGHTAKDEKWISDETGHWKECQCGEKLNFAEHNPGAEADCENDQTCRVCSYVLEAAQGHTPDDKWYSDDNSHWHECHCGEVSDKADHQGVWSIVKEAEIGIEGKKELRCSQCGYLMDEEAIPALKDDTDVKPPVDDEEEIMLGDINNNDKIDMTDYILLKRAYFGTYTFTEEQFNCGDINNNGKIDMTDYILLKRAYFGTYVISQ